MLTDSQREALAVRLRRGRQITVTQIPRRAAGLLEVPMSYAQEQLWFIDRLAPGVPAYNIPNAIAVSGPLHARALRRALEHLVARHEALRTRLAAGPQGRAVQLIDPPGPVPLELADLSGLEPERRQARLQQFIDTEAVRPFNLAEGPLLRTWLLRLAEAEHVLLMVVHHAVFDGWSAGVFVRDLAALYRAEVTGEPSGLAELPVQFADYAGWERDQPHDGALAEYWRTVLDGYPTVQFPTDRPRPFVDDSAGGLATRLTSLELLDGLRALARREGTTLFVTLMAGLQALLYRYTGQDDLVVGTASANRGRAELMPLIGYLVNTLPIRCDLSGDPAFTELLARVRTATTGAYAHQDLPFGKMVEILRVDRDLSRTPVFQVIMTFAERGTTPVSAAGTEFVISDLVAGINAAKFDLDFVAEARGSGLWFECSYRTALFEAATVARLLGHLEVLLTGVVADPSAPLSRLPVLTGPELHQELAAWNDTGAAVPVMCVHQGFEAQVARAPDAAAAEFGDERLSYAELDAQANRIARRLRRAGVGPEVLVGVCMQTGLRRLAALLGVWKAGGGYVPLDPALPMQRLSFMMTDTGLAVVLADASTVARLPETGVAVISLDASWPAISELGDTGLADPAASPANVAYVIYTSGSTGGPKGVVIEHRQAFNFLHGMIGHWPVGACDVVLQFASLSFDASVQEMFMPLLAGARVVLAPARTLHSPARLAALMRKRGITFACLTPSVLSLLGEEQFPDLRVLMCGGEELPSELARRWLRPGLKFVNDYGPTEATITATFMELNAATQLPPPIGWPNRPSYRAYVLDAGLNPAPAGVVGELHIGGAGVARGYLNRPGLTAERFIPDPFSPQGGARLYKTGDLVRRRPDGAIVFTGRADHQVKINGLRIELGEIETALAAHPAVAQAIATVVIGPAGDHQLAAYLRADPGTELSAAELRTYLARTLPAYMIPAHLLTVAAFPLSASGKIDRAALPAPGDEADRSPAGRSAPATATEIALAGLYATVLGREQVGADDSFFDIGGSSLQVMRLVDLISSQVGVDLPVATIFLHPSPRQLAASIDVIRAGHGHSAGNGQSAGPDGPLIKLSTGAGQFPLYLIHPVSGTVFSYTQLARELADTFQVYGLQAPALSGTAATPASLAELVSDYTQRIRAVQPAGPYQLGGWSMGGVIAYEIARRLERAGAHVSLLALLDAPFTIPPMTTPRDTTPGPTTPGPTTPGETTPGGTAPAHAPGEAELAAQFLADAARSVGWDPASLPDPATGPAEQLAWLGRRLATDNADSGVVAGQLRERFEVFQAHVRMLAGYQPMADGAAGANGAPVAVGAPALIITADRSPNARARESWPTVLSGPVSVLPVDADHYSFLQPPLVTDMATAILNRITRKTLVPDPGPSSSG
jgi:amino acid adenylation domain-containing protein